ncbi:MAG: YCF48-related protein, partial [Candidatus Poribacteria bacterium]|nr:YCF48-related protein [Candidatus Poribacteria bacterium]
MTRLIGLLAFCVMVITANAAEWKYVRQPTLTRHVKAVDFADAKNGIFICDRATIATTTDGGTTWTPGSLNALLPAEAKNSTFLDVYYLNSKMIWIVGENGVALKSADGGTTWVLLPTRSYAVFEAVFFVNEKTGWAVGSGGAVIRTKDGGSTWTTLDTKTNNRLGGVWFFDEMNGTVVGDGGTILYTTDGGDTWVSRRSPTALSFNDIQFIGKRGWAIGGNGTAAFTDDGGETWEAQESNVPNSNGMPEPIWGVAFANETRGVASAEFGVLLVTSDAGETWAPLDPRPTLNRLNDVAWLNPTTAVAVGEFGTVLRTKDGGKTWETIYNNSDLFSVSLIGRSGAVVSGHGGTVLQTADGGKSWTKRSIPVPFQLFDVNMVDELRGFIVGDNRTFLETRDGGKSWIPVANPQSETGGEARIETQDGAEIALASYALEFAGAKNGWMIGDLGKSIRTVDGGEHWVSRTLTVQELSPNTLYGGAVLDAKIMYGVGAAGTIIATKDGGATFEQQDASVFSELRDIDFAPDKKTGWAVGSGGTVIHTKDGGAKWTEQVGNVMTDLRSVIAVTAREAWAAGAGGAMIH